MTVDELHREMGKRFDSQDTTLDAINGRLRAVEVWRAFATGVVATLVLALGSMAAWIGLVVA